MIHEKELAKILNKAKPDYHIYEYRDMLKVFTQVMHQLALEGEVVQLNGLGTFYPQYKPARKAYNFQEGTTKEQPPTFLFRFKTSRSLTLKLRKVMKEENKDAIPKDQTNLAVSEDIPECRTVSEN